MQQQPFPAMGGIPLINVGGDALESQFARLQFAQMMLEDQAKDARRREEGRKAGQKMVDAGLVSALDLAAPGKAVDEFNKAAGLIKEQKAKEAVPHLQKALATYPKFVSAHNNLGLAYMDLEQAELARAEFQAAAQLDKAFPGSFLNLGRLALMQQDYASAQKYVGTAARLAPRDPNVLTVLAYAQNGGHAYHEAISTAERVHALEHKGLANVHYVAAAAALELGDAAAAQRELASFVREDPSNALAPVARQNLEVLSHPTALVPVRSDQPAQNLANSDRLREQVAALGDENESAACADCASAPHLPPPPAPASRARSVPGQGWVFRSAVDEVTVFFSVTDHGRVINGLQSSDVQIRDAAKPPAKILEFAPQAMLPLRLGLLVDTSGSVDPRFDFEKRAAIKFLQSIFSGASDLGFVAGFADQPTVTQDFTAEPTELARGIGELTNAGGTALFDAVSTACWKLGAYPEKQRVARVLVVLSDGEDNSSHTSLKQAIRDAEATGVTVYTISTKQAPGDKTDADKVMAALAERTGGEAFFPDGMRSLAASFDRLHDVIRSRYMVAYKPADFRADGRYRPIAIEATQAGKRFQVHARRGYYARYTTTPEN